MIKSVYIQIFMTAKRNNNIIKLSLHVYMFVKFTFFTGGPIGDYDVMIGK